MSSETGGAQTGTTAGSTRTALLDAARAELVEHGAGGVSLRAVARRAGVSHAAPKHHFGDRAGLLTAVAADGFRQLATALRATDGASAGPTEASEATAADPADRVGALGRAYLDFGLAQPALYELMFRSDQLDRFEPELADAQRGALGVFASAVERVTGPDDGAPTGMADALVGWAFIHGLLALVRDGALHSVGVATTPEQAVRVANGLTETFTAMLRAPHG